MKKNDGNWSTNTGQFKSTEMAIASNITLHQWSSKLIIKETKLAVNPNAKQKYKAIFGLDFLLVNKFDVLFSSALIDLEDIGV